MFLLMNIIFVTFLIRAPELSETSSWHSLKGTVIWDFGRLFFGVGIHYSYLLRESSVYSSAKLTEEKQELFGSSIELERDSAELD